MKQSWNPLSRIWNMYREGGLPASLSSGISGGDPSQLAFLRAMQKESQQKKSSELLLADLDVVVVDLETTGFHAFYGDEILSIGAVAMRGSELLDERFFSYVNPRRSIPPHIQSLTGITPEMVEFSPDLVTVLAQFFQFVGNRPLVAHHSRHERDFLQAGLWKTSRTKFQHRLLDTMLLIRLCDGLMRDVSLDALCERNGIVIEHRHDALGDACATGKLWSVYVEKVMAKGLQSLDEVFQQSGG